MLQYLLVAILWGMYIPKYNNIKIILNLDFCHNLFWSKRHDTFLNNIRLLSVIYISDQQNVYVVDWYIYIYISVVGGLYFLHVYLNLNQVRFKSRN